MELLFRRYFWTINLLFLAVAAFLVAKTLNVFTEGMLALPPDLSGGRNLAARPLFAPVSHIDLADFSRITGIPLPKKEPLVKDPVLTKPEDDPNGIPVHTPLHVRLLGTTVSTNKYWSFAMIEDDQNHTNGSYMIDDTIEGATVLEIHDDCSIILDLTDPKPCVIIRHNGRREYIDDKLGTGPVAAAHITHHPRIFAAAQPQPPEHHDNGVHAIDSHHYTVSRNLVNKTLGNLNQVAMQARIVPAFKNGVATGFKLFSIRPNSIYAKIGIQNGDVIRRINGFEINSPEKALEAYTKLKAASRIEIEIERNGQSIEKTYDVQ